MHACPSPARQLYTPLSKSLATDLIVQAGCTPRAWLPSDLATSCLRHSVAKSLSNLALGVQHTHLTDETHDFMAVENASKRKDIKEILQTDLD